MKSTYDRCMEDPEFKKQFEDEYIKLLESEALYALHNKIQDLVGDVEVDLDKPITKKKKSKAKPYCSGTMTESAFFGMIRSNARRLSIKWKPRNDYLKERRRSYSGTDKRIKWEYECAICKLWVIKKDYEIDHIIPCGSLKCFNDVGDFYKRLLCEKEGYRGLCKPCHLKITNEGR